MAVDEARLVAVLEANIKNFQKGMDQAQRIADRRFGQIERRLNQTENRFSRAFRGIGNTLLGGAALFGIQRFVSSVADMAGKLQDTSDALGVGTDALQTWGVLAGRAGISQEQFNKALGQFSQRLGEAQIKGGSFAKFLTGIGVGTQGTTEEVFNRLADAIKNTSSQQQRAAIVAEAFGAKAVRLTPILQQGSAALKAQGIEFAKNGQIMSREAIAKIDELGDKWEDLKRQFLSTGANALGPLVDEISSPAFQQGLKLFAQSLSEVAVVIARMAPHLPLLASVLVGFRTAGPIGAGVGGVLGLGIEAYLRQTGQIKDSIAKLEKDLKNAQDRAARREPGAAGQVADIQAQINHQKAQQAGVPFAGAGSVAPPSGGIDRSGTLSTESDAEAKKKADIEKGIAQDAFDIQQHFREKNAQAEADVAAMNAELQQHYSDVQQTLWEREAEELADFHARAAQAWDDYYEGIAEAAERADQERRDNLEDTLGTISTLMRSSSNELRAIGKAAAIAQATIDGIVAVQKALASAPPPFNFALAALVGAATAANVAEIAAMEKGGRVSANTPYIVGEKRPELFIPDTAGRIVPRVPNAISANGVGNSSVTNAPVFNIDARGAQEGVADQITSALRQFERNFPRMMVKAQRDSL